MAIVKPFKAVRPTRDKANLVVSRSYHVYTSKELEARLAYNPYSFLHILNPGYKYQQEISGEKRFKMVRNRYDEFKDEKFFITETQPAFYLYKKVTRDHTFYGIVGATSVEDYKNNVIKKHEDTIAHKEVLFKEYLKTVGFNAEPVLLTYQDNDTLENLYKEIMSIRPEYEFSTTDKVSHYLWYIHDEEKIKTIQEEFAKMSELYIADGHHRSASSYRLAEDYKNENAKHTGEEDYNFCMSFLIPESNLKIFEFYRLIKDLNGISKEDFLLQLDEVFRIENRGVQQYKPSKKHHFSMYLDGEFYSLYLRKSLYDFKNALDELDAQILYNLVLKPLLGIDDLRNNERIDYFPGTKDAIALKEKMENEEFVMAFGMVPINIQEMKNIANEGLKMPPKSTYIEPKLRSGLTIYEF
ncbi:MAG: DUF1015 domain-containing protein [Flavobacteriaceae bacterium]|nr:DUF1015 domain-containing protein [Flavobacteriaceae bacterium]